jgi:hypothetical protein
MLRMHSTVLHSRGVKLAPTLLMLHVECYAQMCHSCPFEWQEMMLERIQEVAIELGNQLDLGLVLNFRF